MPEPLILSDLIQYVIPAACATVIVNYGGLFSWLRMRSDFFRCSLCVGFWMGFLVALPRFAIPVVDSLVYVAWIAVRIAFMSAVAAYLLFHLMMKLSAYDDGQP